MKQKWAAVALILLFFCGSCTPKRKVPVSVFFAGSLIVPFERLEKAYEAAHPNIDLLMEGHGSIQVIRHVTEIHELIDVVVTADHALIPMLMYAAQVPETGQPYANWYVKFATNRLALAYRPDSVFAEEINTDNWLRVIARPEVKLGISDPRFDACGYRALMVLQMAEKVYDEPMLFEELVTGNFATPVRAVRQGDRLVIQVPEILEVQRQSNVVLRAYSIQLLALLESGDLDYAFEYESVINQHGLRHIPLPDALNLSSESRASEYAQVQVRLDFQRFASVKPVFNGEVIGYGVTIPSNAPHPQEAADFIAFLLGAEGQKLLQDNHQPLINPPQADHYEALPPSLKPLCVPAAET